MKKENLISFCLMSLAFSQPIFAHQAPLKEAQKLPTSISAQKTSKAELNEALKKRYQSYISEKERTSVYKNRKNQLSAHIENLVENGINSQSTLIPRNGDLKYVPYYKDIQPNTKLSTAVPNNAKRNFRVRAYDYYIQSGAAGKAALIENVSDATKEIRLINTQKVGNKNTADVLESVRNAQRTQKKFEAVPAGEQSKTMKIGDWRRNLFSPYINLDAYVNTK